MSSLFCNKTINCKLYIWEVHCWPRGVTIAFDLFYRNSICVSQFFPQKKLCVHKMNFKFEDYCKFRSHLTPDESKPLSETNPVEYITTHQIYLGFLLDIFKVSSSIAGTGWSSHSKQGVADLEMLRKDIIVYLQINLLWGYMCQFALIRSFLSTIVYCNIKLQIRY